MKRTIAVLAATAALSAGIPFLGAETALACSSKHVSDYVLTKVNSVQAAQATYWLQGWTGSEFTNLNSTHKLNDGSARTSLGSNGSYTHLRIAASTNAGIDLEF